MEFHEDMAEVAEEMMDIVERLRGDMCHTVIRECDDDISRMVVHVANDAADEIERLRAALELIKLEAEYTYDTSALGICGDAARKALKQSENDQVTTIP